MHMETPWLFKPLSKQPTLQWEMHASHASSALSIPPNPLIPPPRTLLSSLLPKQLLPTAQDRERELTFRAISPQPGRSSLQHR